MTGQTVIHRPYPAASAADTRAGSNLIVQKQSQPRAGLSPA